LWPSHSSGPLGVGAGRTHPFRANANPTARFDENRIAISTTFVVRK
jgi:hypothetical protein